jgi:sec-independent protein translocase protein TatA
VIGDILQPTHLLFILVIALLVLGPKRLPEVGRSLGRGLRDFRSAVSGIDPREELSDLGFTTPVASEPPATAEAPAEQPVTPAPPTQATPGDSTTPAVPEEATVVEEASAPAASAAAPKPSQ